MEAFFYNFVYKWGLALIAGISTFFIPLQSTLFFVGTLVFCDWVTGMLKGKKVDGKVSSTKMIKKLSAAISYLVAIVVAQYTEIYFQFNPIVEPVAGIILLTEVKSIDENIKEITGKSFLGSALDFIMKKKDINSTN